MTQRILVTGASGFIGRHVVARLAANGHTVVAAARASRLPAMPGLSEVVEVGEIGPSTDWTAALTGCDAVVHLAARTPTRGVTADEFRNVNDLATARLASAVATSPVRLVINMSSAHAIVDNQHPTVVQDDTPPTASAPYSLSKQAAERHVAALAGAGLMAVSLRPPIVYGAQARGNWRLLMKLAATGLPMPFAMVRNRRSMIAVENLADAVAAIVNAPPSERVSGNFNVADDGAPGLRDVFTWLRNGMGRSPRLLPVPPAAITALCLATGHGKLARSLVGNLELDCSRFAAAYRWKPLVAIRDGIKRSGAEFLQETSG